MQSFTRQFPPELSYEIALYALDDFNEAIFDTMNVQATTLEDLKTSKKRLSLRFKNNIVTFCDAVLLHHRLYLAFFPGEPPLKAKAPTLFHLKYMHINLKQIDDATNQKLIAALPLTRLTYMDVMVNEGDFLYVIKWEEMQSVERLYFECGWVDSYEDSDEDDSDDRDDTHDRDDGNRSADGKRNNGDNGDDSDGRSSTDSLEDPLPWDLKWYWSKIYTRFPKLQNAQLYIQGFLDRRDHKDTQYLEVSQRMLGIIHKACPALDIFGIYCAHPKYLFLGGNSIPVRLIYKWDAAQEEWLLTSHAERFPHGWKQSIPGAEDSEDSEDE